MKAISVLGTSSNSGKSWLATALCAWLRRKGLKVAPFKAQNMSNNSCVTLDGGEIGRAQAAQAEACGLLPTVEMNPILLKPSGLCRLAVGRARSRAEARESRRILRAGRGTLADGLRNFGTLEEKVRRAGFGRRGQSGGA